MAGVQVAGAAPAAAEQVAAAAAANPEEVAGVQAAAPAAAAPGDEVAGVRAAGPAAILAVAGETIAGILPATGEPVTLFGIGLLGLAGVGLLMRRIGRRPH